MKKKFIYILLIGLFFVLLNTYLNNNEAYLKISSKWYGYFVPIIWAIFIAMMIDPMVLFLENKFKMKRISSLSAAIFIVIIFILAIFLLIIPQLIVSIKELVQKWPYISQKLETYSREIISYLEVKNISAIKIDDTINQIKDFLANNLGSIKNVIMSVFMNIVWWIIGISNFLIGMFLAVVLVYDRENTIKTRDDMVLVVFGKEKTPYVIRKIKQTKEIFLNYIVAKFITCVLMAVVVSIILMITSTPYSILIGIMLGIGNMIPYIGSIIFGAISIILVLIMEPSKIIYLIISIILVQFLDGFVIGPKIIEEKVGLNTFWVMVSLIFFGGMFGIVGMFLSVPIMCMIKSFYEDILEYRKGKMEK